jgi:hypothetical protein
MDFLTVSYYQVLYPDKGEERARRLAELYKENAKPSCTNVTVDRLNSAPAVLQGFRQALSEASILVLTDKLRNRKAFDAAYGVSGPTAEDRANEHSPGEVSTTGSG